MCSAMAVNFILKKYTEKEIRIVIQDQDKYTLPNLLTKLALRKPGVTFAGYIIEHPMVSYPEVVIVTDGTKNPMEILEEVIAEAKAIANEFLEMLDMVLKNATKERNTNIAH